MTFKEIMQQLGYQDDVKFDLMHSDYPSDIRWYRFWDSETRISIVMNASVHHNRHRIPDFECIKRDKESVFKNPYTEYILWSPKLNAALDKFLFNLDNSF